MDINTVMIAFGLTIIAGISTGVGSLLALLTRRTNTKLLSAVLGFSQGL